MVLSGSGTAARDILNGMLIGGQLKASKQTNMVRVVLEGGSGSRQEGEGERKDENMYVRWKTVYENRIGGALNEDIGNGTGKLGRDYRHREQNSLLLVTDVPVGE